MSEQDTPIESQPGWACRLHGEGAYLDGCVCEPTQLQASLRAITARLDDQVKTNVQLKKDMAHVQRIAEARRSTAAELQRQVQIYALALKGIDTAVQQTRLGLREGTGRDRVIDVKSMTDSHERIIDANGQQQAASPVEA